MYAQPSPRIEPAHEGDHMLGQKDAPVTVIEYADFECPRCKQAAGATKLLIARFKKNVCLVFRHMPHETMHPHSLDAALAAECAGAQGRFWEMHDLLFDNQSRLEHVDLFRYARRLELDMESFAEGMNATRHLNFVRRQQRSVQDTCLRTTPAFFVNGWIHDVSYGVQSLFEAVDAELRTRSSLRIRMASSTKNRSLLLGSISRIVRWWRA